MLVVQRLFISGDCWASLPSSSPCSSCAGYHSGSSTGSWCYSSGSSSASIAPVSGRLELKETHGRTPVLDYSALARIHAGNIAIVPIVPASAASLTAAHSTSTPSPSSLATRYRSKRAQWLKINSSKISSI